MRHGYVKVGIDEMVQRWNGYSLVWVYDHLCGICQHDICTSEKRNHSFTLITQTKSGYCELGYHGLGGYGIGERIKWPSGSDEWVWS